MDKSGKIWTELGQTTPSPFAADQRSKECQPSVFQRFSPHAQLPLANELHYSWDLFAEKPGKTQRFPERISLPVCNVLRSKNLCTVF
jgi:hypothetical protein